MITVYFIFSAVDTSLAILFGSNGLPWVWLAVGAVVFGAIGVYRTIYDPGK